MAQLEVTITLDVVILPVMTLMSLWIRWCVMSSQLSVPPRTTTVHRSRTGLHKSLVVILPVMTLISLWIRWCVMSSQLSVPPRTTTVNRSRTGLSQQSCHHPASDDTNERVDQMVCDVKPTVSSTEDNDCRQIKDWTSQESCRHPASDDTNEPVDQMVCDVKPTVSSTEDNDCQQIKDWTLPESRH